MKESGRPTKRPLQTEPSLYRRRLLLLILALTLVRGLLYLAIFPPWQHYDEPTHFEYVRLIAERGRLPQPDDYDLAMRQEIAASMQAAGFWKDGQAPTLELWSDKPPSIGISELEHPPLYYALQALPQLLVAHQDVETQLYLARLGTVLLNLVVIGATYGLLVEAFPQRTWLPIGVAAFVALLPPFTDLMSAVNNDAGAVAAVSLLLWSSARLARRGPSPRRVATVLLLAGICIATKSTAGVVAVAALLALGIGCASRARRRWVWRGLIVLVPLALLAVFSWGGQAAHWPSEAGAAAPNRLQTQTPLGNAAFALSAEDSSHPRAILQELNRREGRSLAGHTVTVGAWSRAPEGSEGTFTLGLGDGRTERQHQVEATTDWQFHAFTTTVSLDAPGVAVRASLPYSQDAARAVYLDGLILVEGEMPIQAPPQFDTVQATTARWGTHQVTNLLSNGSAEKVWPGLRSWIGHRQMYRTPISLVFLSLWDLPRTGWVYGPDFSVLLQSFWGGFGWNHLTIAPAYLYALGSLTVLGLIGAIIWVVRVRKSHRDIKPWQRGTWAMMATATIVAWGAAILRVHPVFITEHLYWPVARYAVPAIVPTCTLLCLGLAELVPRRWLRGAAWLGLLGLFAFDTIAIWTVVLPYYYG